MLKYISISILLVYPILTGCSSNKQETTLFTNTNHADRTQIEQTINKTPSVIKQQEVKNIKLHLSPPLTDEMKVELTDIFNKNLTEEEKKMLWRDNDILGVKLDMSDVETQLVLICSSPVIYTNANLKTELGNFFERYSYNTLRLDHNKLLQEMISNQAKGQLDNAKLESILK